MKIDLLALLESAKLKDLFAAVVGKESTFSLGAASVAKNWHSQLSLVIHSNAIGGGDALMWVRTKDPINCRNGITYEKVVREPELKIRIEITQNGLMRVSCKCDSQVATPHHINDIFEVVQILESFKIL